MKRGVEEEKELEGRGRYSEGEEKGGGEDDNKVALMFTHRHTDACTPFSQTSTRILGLDSERLTRLSLIAALTAEEGTRRV